MAENTNTQASTTTQTLTTDENAIYVIIHSKEKDKYYNVALQDGATWQTQWKGAPGKFTFKVYKDETLNIAEGDEVIAFKGSTKFFYGFIFSKKRDKDCFIEVTAYDKIRYLKNKGIYVVTGKTASQLINAILDDLQLTERSIADTSYVIPKYRASNQSVLDTIQDVIDMTTENETDSNSEKALPLYVFYDDCGTLTLKKMDDMQSNILIDNETAQNFNYESTIDKETYNQIELYFDDKDTGVRTKIRYPQESTSENIKKWGLLRLVENINPKKPINYNDMAHKKLNYYNRVRRSLSVSGAFGSLKVRGGSMVVVNLNLGDVTLKKKMIVDSVTHKFSNGEHLMDLTLKGDVITG